MAWGLWLCFWLVLLTAFYGTGAMLMAYLNPDLVQVLTRAWGRSLLRLCHVTVQVQGVEHLSPQENYVFAANHQSQFDIFVLAGFLPGQFRWVAKKELFYIPLFGQILSRIGCIPIDRHNLKEAIRTLDRAAAMVQSGTSLIIFPEGTRSTTREILPFKKGGIIMALKAGHPIVPVSISGTGHIQPGATFKVRPGPVKMVIAPPIDPHKYRLNRKEALMADLRQAIVANYDPDFPYGPANAPG